MLKAGFICRELLKKLAHICLFHAINIVIALPYVKGIRPAISAAAGSVLSDNQQPGTFKALS
jgi:hypothetical protein